MTSDSKRTPHAADTETKSISAGGMVMQETSDANPVCGSRYTDHANHRRIDSAHMTVDDYEVVSEIAWWHGSGLQGLGHRTEMPRSPQDDPRRRICRTSAH